jgi:hypothetical protein
MNKSKEMIDMISIARLVKELPEGYEKACFEEKAIERKRGVSSPEDLMMLSLFHLLNGCSLAEMSEIARLTKLGSFSDVAFMKRFEKCCNWFKRIIVELAPHGVANYEKPHWMEKYRAVAVDASDVVEKGRSGRTYRLHFAIDIFSMGSLQYKITTQEVGETLKNFEIEENYLVMADRVYATANGITHCIESGGDFIMRLRKNGLKLLCPNGGKIDLPQALRKLSDGEIADMDVCISGSGGSLIPLRICAKRKPPEAIAWTQKKLRRQESKKQSKIRPETKEFNEYFVLVTSLNSEIPAGEILNAYRYRWQIEMYFKRLKSILDFGDLPKRRPGSVFAWLNGKLMVALLIESAIAKADFSPSG